MATPAAGSDVTWRAHRSGDPVLRAGVRPSSWVTPVTVAVVGGQLRDPVMIHSEGTVCNAPAASQRVGY